MKAIITTVAALLFAPAIALAQQPAAPAPYPQTGVQLAQNDYMPEPKTAIHSTPPHHPSAHHPNRRHHYTEAQARKLLARAGYTHISRLRLDAHDVWWGRATTKRGHRVMVGVNQNGHIMRP